MKLVMNVKVNNPLIEEISSYKLLVVCYNLKTFRVGQEKKPCIKAYIRELNRVFSTKLSILYILKLLVHAIVPLTYSKGHILSLRSIYVKYVIIILFLLRLSTVSYCNT